MHYSDSLPISAYGGAPAGLLQLAAAAYLARFTGSSREHTQSDLRCYLGWRAGRRLDPLAARRPDLELYIRWMRETCRFKPDERSWCARTLMHSPEFQTVPVWPWVTGG
jgi:hypothetical protein